MLALPCCTGLSLAVASGGFSLWRLLITEHSCPVACGIFPDQGSNPRLLHWQADSVPLDHQAGLTEGCLDCFHILAIVNTADEQKYLKSLLSTLLRMHSRNRIAGSDSDSIFNFLSRSNFHLSLFWPSSTPQAGGQARQHTRVWESSLGLLQRRGICTEPSRWPLSTSSRDFKSKFLRISKTLTLESALGSWQGTPHISNRIIGTWDLGGMISQVWPLSHFTDETTDAQRG